MIASPRTTSWIVTFAVCKDCDYNLIITQPPKDVMEDYWWYCSNKECKNHHPGEAIGDMDDCSFEKRVDRGMKYVPEEWHKTRMEQETSSLKREIAYLRQYGNKDCTAMADQAMKEG